MLSLLLSASLARAADPASDDPFFPERMLLVMPPDPPRPGVPWVVRFPGCAPMTSAELLTTIDDPELSLVFRERRRRPIEVGLAGGALAQGLLIGGFFASASAGFNYPTDDDRWVPVGVGMMGVGLLLDYAVIRHFLRFEQRRREPSSWLEVTEAVVYVYRYNEAR